MKLAPDFTKEIRLQTRWQKTYRGLQFLTYLFFVFFAVFTAYKILFPIYEFNYVFGTTGLSNNIINPHQIKSDLPSNSKSQMIFNINQLGDFSKAEINFTAAKNSPPPKNASLTIQKSFQAFFNPIGNALGFKDGSLINVGDEYYLVSSGELRKFSSFDVAEAFGLSRQMFQSATAGDLTYNIAGEDITDSRTLLDDLLFQVGGSYYQFRAGQLWQFTSEKAFLSQYDKSLATAKDEQFLATQKISENLIGYADGTLASVGQSVVILSNGKYYPVDNPITFSGLGYDWNDVIPINSDELSLYLRQKQFTDSSLHPDGTIFVDKNTNEYYMIGNGEKHLLPSPVVLKSYLKHQPVAVSSQSLVIKTAPCLPQKDLWPLDSYSCSVTLEPLNKLIGNDFQFSLVSDSNPNLASIKVKFSTPISYSSAKSTLSFVRNSLKYTYTNQQ